MRGYVIERLYGSGLLVFCLRTAGPQKKKINLSELALHCAAGDSSLTRMRSLVLLLRVVAIYVSLGVCMCFSGDRFNFATHPQTRMRLSSRFDNKIMSLEELEDSEQCTTGCVLKSGGVLELRETDAPPFTSHTGHWTLDDDRFVMIISRTYRAGQVSKSNPTGIGEFLFTVKRRFDGMVEPIAEDIVNIGGVMMNEEEAEVGFFNLVDTGLVEDVGRIKGE